MVPNVKILNKRNFEICLLCRANLDNMAIRENSLCKSKRQKNRKEQLAPQQCLSSPYLEALTSTAFHYFSTLTLCTNMANKQNERGSKDENKIIAERVSGSSQARVPRKVTYIYSLYIHIRESIRE